MSNESVSVELAKELIFGAVCGFAVGFLARKVGANFVAGAAATAFVGVRFAIFDGHHQANWSPLAKDDAAFAKFLLRKARRESHGVGKRLELFIRDNTFVLGGFAGGYFLANVI